MIISKEYLPEMGVVVVTVENPPLATTRHTITAESLADGRVVLADEMVRLEAEAVEKLAAHSAVLDMINE